MCHRAGGLAAHYRFGARSGSAPLLSGLVRLAFRATGTGWPDVIVAAVMAALALQGAWAVMREANGELRQAALRTVPAE